MSAASAAAAAVALAALSCATPAEIDEHVAEPATDVAEPAAEVTPAPSALIPRGGLAWRNYFPNVELITHNGDQVLFYDDLLKGKIVLINFMYASCTES